MFNVFRDLAILIAILTATLPADGAKGPFFDGEHIEFTLSDLDGQVVSSSDPRFEGRVLLIDLWATYCPPCLTEIPTFVELQDKLGDRGLVEVRNGYGYKKRWARKLEATLAELLDAGDQQGR